MVVSENGNKWKYTVRFVLKHSTVMPDEISDALGLKATRFYAVNSDRYTPAGNALEPANHTMWSYSQEVMPDLGFGSDIAKLAERLGNREEFLAHFVESGGTAQLILDLPGDVNIGDVVPFNSLAALAKAKISFGIEVFPYPSGDT